MRVRRGTKSGSTEEILLQGDACTKIVFARTPGASCMVIDSNHSDA